MGNLPGGWELILILLVVILLFGAKRLPDSARALGRSMRILKAETKGMKDDDGAADTTTTTTAQVEATPTPAPGAVPPASPQQQAASAAPVQSPATGQSRQP